MSISKDGINVELLRKRKSEIFDAIHKKAIVYLKLKHRSRKLTYVPRTAIIDLQEKHLDTLIIHNAIYTY